MKLNNSFNNNKLETAFTVYTAAYNSIEPIVTFINLVTCLEILSVEQETTSFTQTKLKDIVSKLQENLKNLHDFELNKRQDISRLIDRISGLKTESKRAKICCLIYKHYIYIPPQ